MNGSITAMTLEGWRSSKFGSSAF